jgi:hypothetical protein
MIDRERALAIIREARRYPAGSTPYASTDDDVLDALVPVIEETSVHG